MSKVKLMAITNIDDTILNWRSDKITDCLGFAIERRRIRTSQDSPVVELVNRVGFAAEAPGPHQTKASSVWPFQRYSWTDHEVSENDVFEYRIVPMIGRPGELVKGESFASDWTVIHAVQPKNGDITCVFNRPLAASQWMADYAKTHHLETSTGLVNALTSAADDQLRELCGGTLLSKLNELLLKTIADPGARLWAALFELDDPKIIAHLMALGSRANVILANGASKATSPDENVEARKVLKDAGCVVHDRMTAPPLGTGGLAHNKFIVFEFPNNDQYVWTGSTNLTVTSLLTQINNGLLIKSRELAKQYKAQWLLLVTAGDSSPALLKKKNPSPGVIINDPANIEPWFTPTVKNNDLDRIRQLIDDAKQGILFLSFMPGPTGPVFDVLDDLANGKFVRGVINQFVGGRSGKLYAHLVSAKPDDAMHLDVVTPIGIKEAFSYWDKEFTKGGRISVLVHSKVICIDAFGDNPVLITGSHNFSSAASESNDENFVIVQGQKELAQAYAVHIYSVYRHYRWRQYVAKTQASGKNPWAKLTSDDSWQDNYINDESQVQEWTFWGL
jgi:phosphatidylserine/phosphatidylglycerophosphate/cardiolipin synthase-like enzyme